jgi:hypothetical protein
MSVAATFSMRKEELHRRVEALPREVGAWKKQTLNDLDSNLHFSQVQAISILVDAFTEQQRTFLGQMDPDGDALAFQNVMLDLIKSIIRSQRMWDFFRDKLDLRFSPTFKEVLWVADTVAWDCYRPVLDGAADAGIISRAELREPPLTYLTAEFSPATWIRGSRPNDGREYHLGTSRLPIPVIEVPWDHVENTWEFLSLHHEVGHDLEADLKLRGPLAARLQDELGAAGVPEERSQTWLSWQGEVFADLVGLQLGGPAFAEGLMHLLLLPAAMVTTFDPEDPHPTPYPRILLNAAYIPTLISGYQPLADHGAEIAARWTDIYGDQPQFQEVINDLPVVFRVLMDTALPVLKNLTMRELMPYRQVDDLRIRNATGYMRTGMSKPAALRPRHVVSAARLAVTQAALQGQLSDNLLTQIHQRALHLVRDNAQPGLRAGDTTGPHKQFIASFTNGW